MISLDGSTLEGGGQIVRVALALSAITLTSVHIYNVRSNRAPSYNRRKGSRVEGGLKESHLAALLWLAEQTDAKVEGAEVGSREVTFKPRKHRSLSARAKEEEVNEVKTFEIGLKKPGSVWLIFQAVFPYIVFSTREKRVDLVLKGGTNVDKSMSGEYVTQVLLPTLRKIGVPVDVEVDVIRRGWASNAPEVGEVAIRIERNTAQDETVLRGFEVKERGEIEKVVVSVVARPESTRRYVIEKLHYVIKQRFGVSVEVVVDEDSGDDRRFYILAVAHSSNGWRLGRDFLGSGAKIKDSTQLDRLVEGSVKRVADELETEINRGGCVDEHLQDQLAIFQALAIGSSVVDAGKARVEGTLHTRTVRWVCEEVLGKCVRFGKTGVCECLGVRLDDESGLLGSFKDLQF